jgi:glycosyltransferase involved in cell wall biosynthesis
MKQPLIVCCAPAFGESWRTLGPGLTGDAVEWVFYDDRPLHFWERTIKKPNLGMIRACLQAVKRASSGNATLLITHDPRASFWCSFFCRIVGIRVDHYVDSFNFAVLPTGMKRRLMSFAFQQIKQLSVHSSMERGLYSNYFNIPEDRIRLRLWSIGVPEVSPDYPLEEGRYVSSLGGNGRDYKTLLAACHRLPEISFVIVVRPESLVGLDVPPNVKVLVNAPFAEAMNILKHSVFTAVPLLGSTVPCGHVTLVCAMHLRKAIVATGSTGISDYVIQDYNGALCEPSDPESLAQAIIGLWDNPIEIERLSENSQRFGAENCSEAKIHSDLAAVLAEWKIPLLADAVAIAEPPPVPTQK